MPECRRCGVALGPTESHLCGTCWYATEDDCDEMAAQDAKDAAVGWTSDAKGEAVLHLGPNDDLDLSDWIEMNGGWAELDDNEEEADV